MNQELLQVHISDKNGNPFGGETTGVGITIRWQEGPLNRGKNRIEPNGAFVEGVIQAALGRLKYYQETKFKCLDNKIAIESLQQALMVLEERTKDRERRKVEGTHAL